MSESAEKVARSYYHGLSDKQWEECKDTFPYCEIVAIAKDYARQKCREQRIICSDHACIESPKVRKEVTTAPEPEFN